MLTGLREAGRAPSLDPAGGLSGPCLVTVGSLDLCLVGASVSVCFKNYEEGSLRYHGGGNTTQGPANGWRVKVKAVQGPATARALRTPRAGPADHTWLATGLGGEEGESGDPRWKARLALPQGRTVADQAPRG